MTPMPLGYPMSATPACGLSLVLQVRDIPGRLLVLMVADIPARGDYTNKTSIPVCSFPPSALHCCEAIRSGLGRQLARIHPVTWRSQVRGFY
ncbi:MAG: hypothetical protein VKL59_02010 [Nostocaceae cyanobacterium]|nr:hypothetical protein [Nostocaceae cyanobacterium]